MTEASVYAEGQRRAALADRIDQRIDQLVDGSVSRRAAVDDLTSMIRKQERLNVADELRDVAGNDQYTIGKLDPAVVEQIAAEIERSR